MKKALLLIFVGLMGYLPIQAQEQADSMCIYYRAGYRYIDPDYRNNREELDRFTRAVRLATDNGTLKRVVIQAGASPDGTQRANERLAKYRVDSLTAYLMRTTGLSSNWFEKRPLGIMWDKLRDLVAASDMPDRDEVLRVLDNEPLWTFDEQDRVIGSRKKTLMDLRGGRPYKYMLREFFPDMRSSALALLYIQQPAPAIEEQPEIPEETEPEQPQPHHHQRLSELRPRLADSLQPHRGDDCENRCVRRQSVIFDADQILRLLHQKGGVHAVINRDPFPGEESGFFPGTQHLRHRAVAEIFRKISSGESEQTCPFGSGADQGALRLQKNLVPFQFRLRHFGCLQLRPAGRGEYNRMSFHLRFRCSFRFAVFPIQ